MSLPKRICCMGFGLVPIVGGASICAQQGGVLHVELVVHAAASGSAPESAAGPSLSVRNVRVELNGSKVTPHMANGQAAAVATHLLVVAEDPATACADWMRAGLAHARNPSRWSISFTDVAGKESAGIVAGATGLCGVKPVAERSPVEALREAAGRRVVLLLKPPSAEFAADLRGLPEVYVVDGGVRVTSETPLIVTPRQAPVGFGGEAAPQTLPCFRPAGGVPVANDLCNVHTVTVGRRNAFADGLSHQKTLPDAVRAIEAAARDYYDLTIPYRTVSSTASLSLALKFRHVAAFTGSADAYLEAPGAAGSQSSRMPMHPKLILQE